MPSLSFAVLPPFLLNLGPDFITILCPTAIGNEGHLKFFPLSFYLLFFKSRYNLYGCCLVAKSCLTLCNLMDCSPPSSFVHGISQARILEWVAIPFSRGSSCMAGRFFTAELLGKPSTIYIQQSRYILEVKLAIHLNLHTLL